jgi:hypothetical protein
MNNEYDFSPSPSRLVESLRDTGYTFPMSIADIIDNSIAAGATEIDLKLISEFDGNLKLKIMDNGSGMTESELIECMKYGSKKRIDPKSLGKFGMGLKTASTAFCKSLLVFSNKDENCSKQWDIDEIISQDKWVLLSTEVDEDDYIEFESFIKGGIGTLVVWDKIDRLIKSKSRTTIEKQLDQTLNDLKRHLSAVFGRFIDNNKYDHEKVEIKVNDEVLNPWDPFCYWMGNGKVERVPKKIPLTIDGEECQMDFNVHILPNKSEMSDEEQTMARYKKGAMENQGFHIYRENRLIYSGGWPNRMFAREPHMNLLRVEINFDHEIDEYFQIDIKKSGIVLPTDLFGSLREILTPLRREANNRYRTGKSSDTSALAKNKDIHKSANASIKKHSDDTVESQITDADADNNTATVKNKFGSIKISIPIEENESDVVVETRESILEGLLWSPAIINGNHGVYLNGSHEYYRRFYLNNLDNPVITQSMDLLIWSLAEAELSCVGDKAKRNIEEMRYMVSKTLRRLAEDLPKNADE